jgi:hypothetical protein
VGITLAVISAIANFLIIPYYPFWDGEARPSRFGPG